MSVHGRRPFTELCEVAQNELVREAASNQEDKFKGFINQVYFDDLPSILPESYIKKEAYITLLAEYTTGTVTVGSATAGIKGASTVWTSAHNNFFIHVDGHDPVLRMTFSADTLLTFQNSLSWVGNTGSGASYILFQDRYQLASDFAYMLADDPDDPNVINRYIGGAPVYLAPLENDEFDRQFSGSTGDPWAYTVKWIGEVPYIMILSAPSAAEILRYQYIPLLTTLTEYTTGTATFTTGTAVVFAGGALLTGNVNTAENTYYIRNDADGTGSASKWEKISTVVNGTALTLSSVWGFSSGTGITYTISEISKWPARFDTAIIYKAALIADPDNAQIKKWESLYQEAVSLDRITESKRSSVRSFKEFFGKRGRK